MMFVAVFSVDECGDQGRCAPQKCPMEAGISELELGSVAIALRG